MASEIFTKQQGIGPSQFAAVAERRYGDAQALVATGDNARANGAQYLAGIVVDILLKAQLMRQYSQIGRKRSHEVSKPEHEVWNLIWRSHDLVEMLDQLPALKAALKKLGDRARKPYLEWLMSICSVWTTHVRYSTKTSLMNEAREMLDRVSQLKEILK